MTDLIFFGYLQGLARGRAPLVAADGDEVQVTARGRDVVEGRADAIALRGIDRWPGGASRGQVMTRAAVRVLRGSAAEGERWQGYEVTAGPDSTVLDALVEIQRGQDPTLAFRYACRVGMCGSCAMVVNGRERWACRTRLATLDDAVDVRPLYHFPVLRDLVVDMTPFFDRMRAVGAALEPRASAPTYAEVPATSAERQEIDAAIECIGCGMCVSACTIVASNERFAGPAALNRAFTLQRDRRDGSQEARWQVLLADDALWRCHGQGNCTEVCPMGLAPTTSIIRLRQMATRRLFMTRQPG